MSTVPRKFRGKWLLLEADLSVLEGAMAGMYLLWGGSLILTRPDLFDSPSYSAMAQWATQHVWGWWFIFIGMVKGIGTCWDMTVLRFMGAAFGASTWVFVISSYAFGGPLPPSTYVYVILVVCCVLTAQRQVLRYLRRTDISTAIKRVQTKEHYVEGE